MFHDMDGSLTNKGPNSFATYYYKHLEQPGCVRDEDLFNGMICDSSAPLRRVAFHAAQPSSIFRGMPIYIAKWDDSVVSSQQNLTTYLYDKKEFTKWAQKPFRDPSDAWTLPFVTGHKYRVHWGD